MEWYLARLIAAVKNCWGGDVDWRDELIGYEAPDQTLEEAFAAFCAVETSICETNHGDNQQS